MVFVAKVGLPRAGRFWMWAPPPRELTKLPPDGGAGAPMVADVTCEGTGEDQLLSPPAKVDTSSAGSAGVLKLVASDLLTVAGLNNKASTYLIGCKKGLSSFGTSVPSGLMFSSGGRTARPLVLGPNAVALLRHCPDICMVAKMVATLE
jgi:hypothetical protein